MAANDSDVGENAKIEYSLAPPSQKFIIEGLCLSINYVSAYFMFWFNLDTAILVTMISKKESFQQFFNFVRISIETATTARRTVVRFSGLEIYLFYLL